MSPSGFSCIRFVAYLYSLKLHRLFIIIVVLQIPQMGNCISEKHGDHQKRQYSISRFRFVEVIGKGSFGKVWKVIDKMTNELCALKIMDKAQIIANKCLKTVILEKTVLETLAVDRSDLISNIKAAFQDREKVYILMQFISGRNLRAYLTKERKLNEQQIKFIIVTLLKIIRYIHSKNIIHRDIKPENIMIDNRGFPHIADFGIATFFNKNNAHCNGGTLPYMAPEVILGLNHNFSIDYYALGIITFQLFFQHRPHDGDTYDELKQDILISCPQLSSISPQAAEFIMQITRRDADERLGNHSISEVFDHPWINSDNNDSLIIKNSVNIFQNIDSTPLKTKEADEIKSQEGNELMKSLLDRQHIQKMFEPFNFSLDHKREDPESPPILKVRRFSLTAQDLRKFHNQIIEV